MPPAQKSKVAKAGAKGKGAKGKKAAPSKFTLDASEPVRDELFDVAAFERYLKERIKVDGRTGNLGDAVTVSRAGNIVSVTVQPGTPFAKRYLKYLTKKFLKKNLIREYLRVIATEKGAYVLRYYKVDQGEDEEGADE
ncbi:60S ribosomal protein L22-like protein [Hyaloraphidium curvatum]|nr:60S ribosomal protein L22-like protein [Hyaloraphidium curvatum]